MKNIKNPNFLQALAAYLHRKHPDDLHEQVVVLPNIRAGLYLRKYLGEHIQKPAWAPSIITIQEFFHKQSSLQPEEPIPLVFELYKSIKHIAPGLFDSFDAFYPWGEIMLSDFNDIDKNLTDPAKLFTNLSDLKEIDAMYADVNQELLDHLHKFWEQFQAEVSHHSKDSFLQLWKILPEVYQHYTDTLKNNHTGYEGLITRTVAENLNNELFPEEKPGHYFVGFNVLSKAEEQVFRYYKNQHHAKFFWQYDEDLLHDQYHEAFRFVRDMLKKFPAPPDFTYHSKIRKKNAVNVYAVPSNTAQVKLASKLLDEKIRPDDPGFEHTGLILPDESLLHPVLYSMPASVKHLNVTMGYPISYAPQTSIIGLIARLQDNYASGKYYHQDVLRVLNHPLVQLVAHDDCARLKKVILEKNMIRVPEKDLLTGTHDLIDRVFTHTSDIMAMGPYFSHILKTMYESMHDLDDVEFDKEIVYQMYRHINRFNEYLIKDRIHFTSVKTYLWLVSSMLNNLSVSFSGEPMKGLQVMGMLETRLIDFDKLIILSMNEGRFPGQSFKKSFIPYSLRNAFQLPTIELQDAVHAYYFYRMFMHPGEVYLLYNTSAEGFYTGEKSRYIQQIIHETDIPVAEIAVHNQTVSKKKDKRTVKKDAGAMHVLSQYRGDNASRAFSASQLNTYMKCSMAFYYKYILNIKEPDEMLEQIGPLELGNVLHDTMQQLYAPHKDKEISLQDVDRMLKARDHRDQVVMDAFVKHMKVGADQINGINAMGVEAVKMYVENILTKDKQRAPFVYKGGEIKVSAFLQATQGKWKCKGIIDRLEESNNQLRVIDYKTGTQKPATVDDLEALFEHNRNDKPDHVFQVLFYTWLMHKNQTNDEQACALYPVIMYMRNAQSSDKPVMKGVDDFRNLMPAFEEQLVGLLERITDKTEPFTMTEHTKTCENCPYHQICY
ncbi:MAG: PD-(D/E)XK nuclease family protein [Bacteroidota bacterium]|nr:PD-(D/E)XK nuclease family protein [Bacteroidota bacterium]